jgi:hypothetical protein
MSSLNLLSLLRLHERRVIVYFGKFFVDCGDIFDLCAHGMDPATMEEILDGQTFHCLDIIMKELFSNLNCLICR